MPGQPCDNASYSTSSYSSVSCESEIQYGTVEDYKNGNENLPGPKIVYTKDVVDQIIEDKLAQCRQDPKSCGINAIPLITETSDPNEVLNQIKNKDLNINGYYIHYGNGTYEWIYIPVSLRSAYKLEKGVNENYSLRWTPLPQGIKIEKQGKKIKITK